MVRVFPRKNNATPDDGFFTGPPFEYVGEDDVHVSCTFTYDIPKAEFLAKQWETAGYDVKIGGPAYGDRGDEFVPGRYIKKGYTMTSRGCNNKCWFCYVWKREGKIRELEIKDGWNILDSNLLQCSELHIRKVFDMLGKQEKKPVFTGGLEADKLQDWHVDLLKKVKTSRLYLAYDTPDDYEPLRRAAKMLSDAKVCGGHDRCCYVLIGHPKDTIDQAEKRLKDVLALKLTPMAMLYRDNKGLRDPDWLKFQTVWANPYRIYGKKKRDESRNLFSEAIK